jgi:hypothetical protein
MAGCDNGRLRDRRTLIGIHRSIRLTDPPNPINRSQLSALTRRHRQYTIPSQALLLVLAARRQAFDWLIPLKFEYDSSPLPSHSPIHINLIGSSTPRTPAFQIRKFNNNNNNNNEKKKQQICFGTVVK